MTLIEVCVTNKHPQRLIIEVNYLCMHALDYETRFLHFGLYFD